MDEQKNEKARFDLFEKALTEYMNTYFIRRDLPGTLAFLSDSLTGVGTGIDEIAYDRETFTKLYERDISDAPNSIHYTIRHKKITPVSENIAIALCQFDISTEVSGQKISLNHLRQTLILSIHEDKVLIEHKHISFPTDVHGEGESYPLKEIEDVTKKLDSMVREKTSTLMEAYKELEKAVVTDRLTQLFNRNRIDEILLSETNRSSRYGKEFSIILADIDHFKNINDMYGHLFGDQVLIEISQTIKNSIRNTDFVGRWGGEEIIIILPETPIETAVNIGEKIRHAISRIPFDNNAGVTISMGVSTFIRGDTVQSIFTRTDKALYRAKNTGRNKVVSL